MITVRFKPRLEDAVELHSRHRRATVRPAFRVALHIVSGCLLVLGTYGLFRGIASSAVVFIAGLYYPVLRPLERRWQVERAFTKDPDKDLEIEWQISEQSLKVMTSKWASELTWPAVTNALCAPTGLLLYVSGTPLWLPKRGFGADGAFERLLDIIRSKVPGLTYVS